VNELSCALPIPAHATELLDLSGRWCRERHPQRHPLPLGSWVRESRRGRTGHDATLGLLAGTPGFGSRHGEVWAVHVAWSGNHLSYAERWPSGEGVLGGGELLLPGEVELAPGEEYATPWVYAAWSPRGLDGVAAAFHGHLRARPGHPGPDRPRPVVLNTWEAVYFDHDLDRLKALADTAAELGVERFVLDDGWFRHRRDDTAGLGDWYVDETVWPQGLAPLVGHVRALGMQFGLWVEPEMVNPDSDLFRAHPDWVLQTGGRLPPAARNQQVLDLANPDAFEHVRSRLDALLSEYDIAYLKWDHNRDLVDAGHQGRAGVHAQTLAVYRLLDELRAAHPGVEIESCSSGGARVDLGILERTDRVWASDCNDALERQAIQRWTGLLLPPELIGTHVGPPRSTPPAASTTCRSGRRPRCSGTPASNGTSPPPHRRSAPRWRPGSSSTSATVACCTPARSSTPTIPTPRRRCTGWSPPTARRRCTPTSSSRPRRWPCRCRCGLPAWTRPAATWSSRSTPPARRGPPSGCRRPGTPPAGSPCPAACSPRSGWPCPCWTPSRRCCSG
jgi:alpha-galactosidase